MVSRCAAFVILSLALRGWASEIPPTGVLLPVGGTGTDPVGWLETGSMHRLPGGRDADAIPLPWEGRAWRLGRASVTLVGRDGADILGEAFVPVLGLPAPRVLAVLSSRKTVHVVDSRAGTMGPALEGAESLTDATWPMALESQGAVAVPIGRSWKVWRPDGTVLPGTFDVVASTVAGPGAFFVRTGRTGPMQRIFADGTVDPSFTAPGGCMGILPSVDGRGLLGYVGAAVSGRYPKGILDLQGKVLLPASLRSVARWAGNTGVGIDDQGRPVHLANHEGAITVTVIEDVPAIAGMTPGAAFSTGGSLWHGQNGGVLLDAARQVSGTFDGAFQAFPDPRAQAWMIQNPSATAGPRFVLADGRIETCSSEGTVLLMRVSLLGMSLKQGAMQPPAGP